MFTVKNGKYKEIQFLTSSHCVEVQDQIKDFDFAGFKFGELDFLLHKYIDKNRARLIYDMETHVLFFTDVPLLVSFPSYPKIDLFKKNESNQFTKFSCLGRPADGRRPKHRWINTDRPDHWIKKILSIKNLIKERNVMFFGTMTLSTGGGRTPTFL